MTKSPWGNPPKMSNNDEAHARTVALLNSSGLEQIDIICSDPECPEPLHKMGPTARLYLKMLIESAAKEKGHELPEGMTRAIDSCGELLTATMLGMVTEEVTKNNLHHPFNSDFMQNMLSKGMNNLQKNIGEYLNKMVEGKIP